MPLHHDDDDDDDDDDDGRFSYQGGSKIIS